MVSSDFLGNSFAGIAVEKCIRDVPLPPAPDRMLKGREHARARAFGGDLHVAREKSLSFLFIRIPVTPPQLVLHRSRTLV